MYFFVVNCTLVMSFVNSDWHTMYKLLHTVFLILNLFLYYIFLFGVVLQCVSKKHITMINMT